MAEESQGSLEMLKTALEMEKKGEKYYAEAAEKTQNPMGQEIWKMLRSDELVHMNRIKKIYESISGGQPWSEELFAEATQHTDLNQVFGNLTKKHGKDIKADTPDLKAIDVGIDLELNAINYYEKHLTGAQDPMERKFLNRMIDEEKSHYLALSDMKMYLIDPVGWFRDKESTHLDGYT